MWNFNYLPTDFLNGVYAYSIADHVIKKFNFTNKFSIDQFSYLRRSHGLFHLKLFEIVLLGADSTLSVKRGNV